MWFYWDGVKMFGVFCEVCGGLWVRKKKGENRWLSFEDQCEEIQRTHSGSRVDVSIYVYVLTGV
tara:strand:+ start:91 stop:282 length:192 start_codon:yes stop_codon:yes gene_type:complete